MLSFQALLMFIGLHCFKHLSVTLSLLKHTPRETHTQCPTFVSRNILNSSLLIMIHALRYKCVSVSLSQGFYVLALFTEPVKDNIFKHRHLIDLRYVM